MGFELVQVVTQKSKKFNSGTSLFFLKQRLRDFQIFFVPVGADLVEYQFAQKNASNKVHTCLNVI